jgi:hypothetical protein
MQQWKINVYILVIVLLIMIHHMNRHFINSGPRLFLALYMVAFLILGIVLLFPTINVSYAQRTANLITDPDFSSSGSSRWTGKNCQTIFKCTMNSTTGWKDNTSLQLSTNRTSTNTWSSITGREIQVKPDQQYQFITHMKLNEFATASHIAIEGFNATSNKWKQIAQDPPGTNGPSGWQEYTREITIPENMTKIRPVLNAGWSSQPGKQAVTLFDALSLTELTEGSNNPIGGFIPRASSG